jgi:hypothetical protein
VVWRGKCSYLVGLRLCSWMTHRLLLPPLIDMCLALPRRRAKRGACACEGVGDRGEEMKESAPTYISKLITSRGSRRPCPRRRPCVGGLYLRRGGRCRPLEEEKNRREAVREEVEESVRWCRRDGASCGWCGWLEPWLLSRSCVVSHRGLLLVLCCRRCGVRT